MKSDEYIKQHFGVKKKDHRRKELTWGIHLIWTSGSILLLDESVSLSWGWGLISQTSLSCIDGSWTVTLYFKLSSFGLNSGTCGVVIRRLSSFCVLDDILFSLHLYWWYLWVLTVLVDPVLTVAVDESLFLWRPSKESSEEVKNSSLWRVCWNWDKIKLLNMMMRA